MIRLDPPVDQLKTAIEGNVQDFRAAGGSPEGVIAWFANYLGHVIQAQLAKLRDEIKSVVHQRICEMD